MTQLRTNSLVQDLKSLLIFIILIVDIIDRMITELPEPSMFYCAFVRKL